ncbi:gliding motility-associated C-terminal domain-containing protein [uncultured Tenacibaculum sp.]|uniref:T9SS type B sorting domain-containing protein n=1 Tax=uncultured Tenacibaculum sp. TaxID=174713 RepID=UPI0026212C10|nr:gliding motility-associated C-terminal domain-containing protein [uncultured Tenacibaculum sp.]
MYKHIKALTFFIIAIGLLYSHHVVGQTLLKPELSFGTSACDDTNVKKDFVITIRVGGSTFDSDNKFTIELSDANGSFASPTIVREITDASINSQFNPAVSFQLPDGTFGSGYKIRIKADKPAATSPESDAFSAYDMIGDGPILMLVNANATLCGTDTFTIEIASISGETGVFEWFKDGALTPFTTTTEPRLTVSQAGDYQARIDYGVCGTRQSIIAKVVGLTVADAQIIGANEIEICGNETHTFEATTQNTALYNYQWFRDGTAINGATSPTYETVAGQFGKYKVQISSKDGSCSVESSAEVELKQKGGASFSVNNVPIDNNIVLPGEGKKLEVTIEPSSVAVTYQWFKDGNPLPSTSSEWTAVEPGCYYVQVTSTASSSSSCPEIVNSEEVCLLGVSEFITTIIADPYIECQSTNTTLKIIGIDVKATDDKTYGLSDAQLNATPALLSYQWHNATGPITGATGTTYAIGSYTENGSYFLNVEAGNKNTNSDPLDIKLIAPDPIIDSNQASNSLCDGGTIRYTIRDGLLAGYTYEWYKDGAAAPFATNVDFIDVTEVGSYTLKFFDANCSKTLDPIEVVPFDESVVQVTPSEIVVLQVGQTVTVTASGAESYVWYQGDGTTGTILSTNETLDVSAFGFYTVVATVGSCTVEKKIEAVEQDDQLIVPNIVSPNGDGINDTWQITNRLAFQPTVDIIIFNANGKEVFKTTDYQNNWPQENLGNQKVFYYKIIREDVLVKAGTISVLD